MEQRNNILEPRPWQQCSFAVFAKRGEFMIQWDESLRNMRHCEWVIHRKLGEAAGLAHRYLCPARGSGKSMFIDSVDDPKMILRKNRKEPEQEFVTIKDGDIEKWLRTEINRETIENVTRCLYEIYPQADIRDIHRQVLSSFNPYRQPEGYWYDPTWEVRADGSIWMSELSIMPGYLLDEDDLNSNLEVYWR